MKFEKECYIGNVYYTTNYDGKYNLSFSCILSNSISEKEKEMFDKFKESIKIKLTLEIEKPILDEEERKYLSSVIKPFRNRTKCISKYNDGEYEYIRIATKNKYAERSTWLPPFKKGSMYKNMELNKEYSLEELGL